jgi:parallel beta-helix repeat protein
MPVQRLFSWATHKRFTPSHMRGGLALAVTLLFCACVCGCGLSTGPSASSTGGSTQPPPPPPQTTNYYVSSGGSDSGDGSQSAPWRTIQYAANHIAAGAMVHVAPGTYPEAVDINISGTTSQHPIWFLSDTQWAAKVTGTASSNYTFYVESDHVYIEGFDISNVNTSAHEGILDIGSYFYAVGNKVHDIAHVGGSDGLGGAGILLGNDQGEGTSCCGYALENIVYNIGNFTVPWASIHGIYIEEPQGVIANNITYENQGCGIQLWHNASNIVVANNTIFNNGLCGIVIGATFTPPDTISDYNLVFNNTVVYNGTNSDANCGIWEDGNTGTHNQYPNNLAYQNNPNGTSDFCLLNGNTAPNSVITFPLFVDYQADGSGDYHLQSTSPAIDAGVNFMGDAPTIDYAGGSRPIGATWDIGAYEFGSTQATWPWPTPQN